jgi:hypothetical protein
VLWWRRACRTLSESKTLTNKRTTQRTNHAGGGGGGGKKTKGKRDRDREWERGQQVLLGVEDWVYFAVPHHRDQGLCEDTRTALLHCLAARLEGARRGRGRSSSAFAVPGADAFLEAVCFALEKVEMEMEHCAGEVGV